MASPGQQGVWVRQAQAALLDGGRTQQCGNICSSLMRKLTSLGGKITAGAIAKGLNHVVAGDGRE